jgi:hypothetical protein
MKMKRNMEPKRNSVSRGSVLDCARPLALLSCTKSAKAEEGFRSPKSGDNSFII